MSFCFCFLASVLGGGLGWGCGLVDKMGEGGSMIWKKKRGGGYRGGRWESGGEGRLTLNDVQRLTASHRECWCAQRLSAASAKLSDSECNLGCDGDAQTACGGALKLTVSSRPLVARPCPYSCRFGPTTPLDPDSRPHTVDDHVVSTWLTRGRYL